MSRPSWAIVALLAVALAIDSPAPAQQSAPGLGELAARTCAKERKQIGRRVFERKYGDADAMTECLTYTLDSLLEPGREPGEGDEDESDVEEFA